MLLITKTAKTVITLLEQSWWWDEYGAHNLDLQLFKYSPLQANLCNRR